MAGVRAFAKVLLNNWALKSLALGTAVVYDSNLVDARIGYARMVALAEPLMQNHTLESLYLGTKSPRNVSPAGYNKLQNEGAGLLADVLRRNHTLTTLSIRNIVRRKTISGQRYRLRGGKEARRCAQTERMRPAGPRP